MKGRKKGKREKQYECLQNLLGPKKRVFCGGGGWRGMGISLRGGEETKRECSFEKS